MPVPNVSLKERLAAIQKRDPDLYIVVESIVSDIRALAAKLDGANVASGGNLAILNTKE